jgi:copper transport protein
VSRKGRAAAVAVCALVFPAAAAAHPRAVGSAPAADAVLTSGPAVVQVRFDEDVDPVGDALTVLGPSGSDAATGPLRRRGRMLERTVRAGARGTYLVEWSVVGADTHPARGAFLFSVGEATRSGAPGASRLGVALQAAGRWLSLAGLALGYGIPFAAAAALGGTMTSRLWRLVGAGIALMLVAEPVALLGQTVTLQPSHPFRPRLVGDVLLTSYGHVTGLRLGGALALWALAGAVRASSSRRLLWVIAGIGAALTLVHGDAAHRIDGIPAAASLLVAAVHVAAAAAWLGLVVVAAAVPGALTRRLAVCAVAATAVLAVSGAGLAVGQLGAVADLVRGAYGEALLVKLAVVAAALTAGALGRRRAELALGAGVLAAATVVVSLLPPP